MDRRSYIIRRISKDNGEFREIAEPRPRLKELQRSVLRWLMARRIGPSKYAQGFVKNRSIVTNALPHVSKRVVLRVDIKDFFGSITKEQVLNALTNEGISPEDAQRIAEICTLDNYLPQGAPTSPLLSNLVLKKLDYRLGGLAKKWDDEKYHTAYTRYADDMTFSSNSSGFHRRLLPIVEKFVQEEGFELNTAKTKILRNGNRQTVTGIVVNQKTNVSRVERRRFRAELHNVSQALIDGKNVDVNLAKLQGKAAFIAAVNPETGRRFLQEVNQIKALLTVRKQLVQTG